MSFAARIKGSWLAASVSPQRSIQAHWHLITENQRVWGCVWWGGVADLSSLLYPSSRKKTRSETDYSRRVTVAVQMLNLCDSRWKPQQQETQVVDLSLTSSVFKRHHFHILRCAKNDQRTDNHYLVLSGFSLPHKWVVRSMASLYQQL